MANVTFESETNSNHASPMETDSTLYIVDLSSFIFRSFYAIRLLNAPDGTPVNAVYGVLSMFLKLIADKNPTHLVVAQDSKEKNFRHELYKEYKANRSEPPDALKPQFHIVDQLLDVLQIPRIRAPGFEADDIIASLAIQMKNNFKKIIIVSADKDLYQLVNDQVLIWDTMKDRVFDSNQVLEKMGVLPSQIVDYLALVGDASDNVPGVKGIGEKGAVKILQKNASIEALYEKLEEIDNPKLKQTLELSRENAFLSKKLVSLNSEIKLDKLAEDLKYSFQPQSSLQEFLMKLGFKTYLQKFFELSKSKELRVSKDPNMPISGSSSVHAPEQLPLVASETIKSLDVLELKKQLQQNNMEDISISFDELFQMYLYHPSKGIEQVVLEEKNGVLRVLVSASNSSANKLTFYTYQAKEFYHQLLKANITFPSAYRVVDVLLANFLLNTEAKNDIEDLLFEEDQGLPNQSMQNIALRVLPKLQKIAQRKLKQLSEINLLSSFTNYEIPLCAILATMEFKGIILDKSFLKNCETTLTQESLNIEKKIREFCDPGINLNLKSPKQVSVLLFEKLQLPIIKKTKTGLSTDSSVLEKLALLDLHPIPAMLLQYREIEKLLSTYIKNLPDLVSPATNRLHTHFHQNIASTGRLTSDGPNLQNIPIKTQNGKLLRKAFVASEGKVLISADYSQIELRILAHYCKDPVMLEAFAHDKDIHTQTASEIFFTPLEKITPEQRNNAKAINFGLIYGQSSFGLSETLNISQKEAKEYITHYFQKFPHVKSYLDSLRQLCEEKGYAETLLGRRRYLPDIRSSNRMLKSAAERMAINTPIQGTAADILKIAMVNLSSKLLSLSPQSCVLLQVHDELLIESPLAEAKEVALLTRSVMETAVTFSIPLKVDLSIGKNWLEMDEL